MNGNQGNGPAIWLAGDPEDLKDRLHYGAAGIVTNTVVLNEMVQKYGQLTEVTKRYLDITDLPVVIEVDGESAEELLEVSAIFTAMSDQIMIKLPCTVHALPAFTELKKQGVATMCTTTFSLAQTNAVALAGATHVLPFCEPVKELGGDPTELVRDCVRVLGAWTERPLITAALVRSVEVAHLAIRDGADGIIVFWPIYEQMLAHPLTDQWNGTFRGQWDEMHEVGLMKGVPVRS
jgi:transaldolase